MKPKLPKKKCIKAIKKRARNIFSKLVRLKNSVDGYCTCVTCGQSNSIKNTHAGHYIHALLPTLFDETNVHPQCVACNTYRSGNLTKYALWLERNYYPGILQELEIKSNQSIKISYPQYEDMIAEWKEEIKDIETGKGLFYDRD